MGGDVAAIDACFRRALVDARERGMKSLELRAATSAARVWQQRGARALARETLVPVYNWFTEGFGTADLTAARSLLETLTLALWRANRFPPKNASSGLAVMREAAPVLAARARAK